MPRKTKEQTKLENETTETKKVTKKSTTTKKATTSTKKVAQTKKNTTSTKSKVKASTTKTKESKETKKPKTRASKKVSEDVKVAKKASSTSKKSTTKKSTAKKSTSAKTTTKTKSTKKKKDEKVEIVEYYDLPYRYNQTVVKVLAQTPTNLFIYWDISDADRKNFEKQYGENFFETTKPILIVHNDTLGYSFEVEINDFANSWYLHVNDAKCNYRVELGRRPIIRTENVNTDYIYISMSNKIESPNDHILFDKNQKTISFRNVKTGVQTKKDITSLSFMKNIGKLYDIYDIFELYKLLYNEENIQNIYDLSNPSSGNPSSRKPYFFEF